MVTPKTNTIVLKRITVNKIKTFDLGAAETE